MTAPNLTPGRRRAIVRSALGAMVHRLRPDVIAAIAAKADRRRCDAAETARLAIAWGGACRRALELGRPLPSDLLDY